MEALETVLTALVTSGIWWPLILSGVIACTFVIVAACRRSRSW